MEVKKYNPRIVFLVGFGCQDIGVLLPGNFFEKDDGANRGETMFTLSALLSVL